MKTIYLTAVLLALGICLSGAQTPPSQAIAPSPSQTNAPASTPFQVVNRDANYKVWQRTVYEQTPDGKIVPHVHAFTEVASGLCHLEGGQFVDSSEEIAIQPDGTAAATQGQHQVYFPSDIYQGTIQLVTPDGLQLQSQPVALAYDDGSNTVIIAVLTNSVGQLLGTNRVIYAQAFSGINADVLYSYKKFGAEQDIVLHQRPPAPESLGLNPSTTKLQMLTEFFNPPDPIQATSNSSESGLTDTTLKFGSATFGRGRAFLLGNGSPTNRPNRSSRVPVYKSWLKLQGRTFLIESVPLNLISSHLQSLPGSASVTKPTKPKLYALHGTAGHYQLPAAHKLAVNGSRARFVKQNTVEQTGFVLDYVELNEDQNNFTFKGDVTYLVDGAFNLTGTTTIEGGTVVKSDINGQINIDANGTIVCKTGPYQPGIFTSLNDDSVGESMGSSGDAYYTGSPAYTDVNFCLNLNCSNAVLSNLRFCYAQLGAICTDGNSPGGYWPVQNLDIWDSQFVDMDCVITAGGVLNLGLHNVLFSKVGLNGDQPIEFSNDAGNLTAEQCTFDTDYPLIYDGSSSTYAGFTNCIVTGAAIGGTMTSTQDVVVQYTGSIETNYQVMGAGYYYLATNSLYRSAGTTNISPEMLAELSRKTTYPPLSLAATNITTDITLVPVVQRNTGIPDIGYHYDPIDYSVGCIVSNATLNLTGGVVVAYGLISYHGRGSVGGIALGAGGNLISQGAADANNCIIYYNTVQEQPMENFDSYNVVVDTLLGTHTATVSLNFTTILTPTTVTAQGGLAIYLQDASCTLSLNDCEFYSGAAGISTVAGDYYSIYNDLFYRTPLNLSGNGLCNIHNCLFAGDSDSDVSISGGTNTDNAFDNCNSTLGGTLGHNAYLNGAPPPATLQSGDIVTNLSWAYGPLGSFYQPSASPLLNMGTTNANLLGLYHFTTQTNQIPDGTNIVSIGYHYVAANTNGNPLDSNGDGVPDYLEDANGDGLVDNGETNWALAILVQPSSYAVARGSNVTLNVTAAGIAPLHYQWYFNGTNILAGATNSSLPLTISQFWQAGNYSVTVTNNFGSLISSNASIMFLNTMVVAWGEDFFDQCDPPLGLTNAIMLAGGGGYTIALLNNGTVVGWGNRTTEGMVPTSLTGVAMIASGIDHKTVLLTNGTVEAWGNNLYGATNVPANLTNATAISAQYLHTIALRNNGTVVSWGDNLSSSGENDVPAGLTNAIAVAAGGEFNLAITNGRVAAWGDNSYGQCNIPIGLTNVVDVRAGFAHSVALKQDGTVAVWGDNTFGQTNIPPGLSNVIAIAAGGYYDDYPYEPYSGYVMALKKDGTLVVWGANKIAGPVQGMNNVTAINGEYDSALAIRTGPPTPAITLEPADQYQITNGTVTFTSRGAGLYGVTYQWQTNGVNIAGATNATLVVSNVQPTQLGPYDVIVTDNGGLGGLTSSNAFIHLVTSPVVTSVAPSTNLVVLYQNNFTLAAAVTATGWTNGFPLSYQWLLNGTNISFASGSNYTFTVTSSGIYSLIVSNAVGVVTVNWLVQVENPNGIVEWGANGSSQLFPSFNLTNASALAAGRSHALAVLDGQTVVAWGDNTFGQTNVPPGLSNVLAVAAGATHNLALKTDGTVVGWGGNDAGQTNVPVTVSNAIAISAGGHQSLALLQNGTVVQWGLTNGPIPAGLTNVTAIACGTNFNLALLKNSTIVAWGDNSLNQTNVPPGLSNVVAIAAGGAHALALKGDGTVTAWGSWTNVPSSLSNVLNAAAGENHDIALKNDGTVICWGDNTSGQTNVLPGLSGTKLIAGGGNFTLASQFSTYTSYPINVPQDLLLIYNTNSQDSITVLNYYLAHRPGVSNANVLAIGYTNSVSPGYDEVITPTDETNQILKPVSSWINSNPTKRPQYVILFRDIPARVYGDTTFPTNSNYPEGGTRYQSVDVQLTSITTSWQPFVSHINMNGSNDCIAYINKLARIGSPIYNGSVVLSASATGYGNTNYILDNVRFDVAGGENYSIFGGVISSATNTLISVGVSSTSIEYCNSLIVSNYFNADANYFVTTFLNGTSITTVTNDHIIFDITNASNVAGYVSWGVHGGVNPSDITDGAISWHGNSAWWLINTEESYNGQQFNSQGNFINWYSSTAFGGINYSNTPVGAVTTVDEPDLSGKNDNSIYFSLWARGENFGMCAWNSKESFLFQAVGDPLIVK